MASASVSRILLCADTPAAGDEVRQLLEQAGHSVGWHAVPAGEVRDAMDWDLIVLEGGPRPREVLPFCRRLRTRLADAFVPILFVTADPNPAARLTSLEAGADAYLLRPFVPGELLAQVQAFLRLKGIHDRLTEKTAEFHRVNKRLQQAYQQIDQELQLARRVQHSMLPQTLPDVPPLRFAVHYRPCGRVGGDFYDVFRLDEDRVGFYVADVMGHGVPAGLLTIFLKKAIRTKEINGRNYRLLAPDEVLQHLNRDMIDQALAESPFITMVYALLDRRLATLTFSRAGHPHPLYVPQDGELESWQVHGTLLGIFDTQFQVQTRQLRPGDKVLLYTDGLEGGSEDSPRQAGERLLQEAARLRKLPIDALVEQLSHGLLHQSPQTDDFTLLGVEIRE
jgi:sigma-B regulation protein RsbU (phosphoserine phosphatase)